MGVENIIVVVCIWHHGMAGHMGAEMFKHVLERSKELLTSLHMKVLEAEKVEEQNT